VIARAVTHADNVYNIPDLIICGKICKTNLPSNTAFRGFGGPQAMMIMEEVMSQVAAHLSMPPEDLRLKNMYQEGDLTPFDMPLTDCNISRCWQELQNSCELKCRRQSTEDFKQ